MAKQPSLDLFLHVEGLSWTLAEKRAVLAWSLPYRSRCDTFFGTNAACVPSILTGRLPCEHGHFAEHVFDPGRSPFRELAWLRWIPWWLSAETPFTPALSTFIARQARLNRPFALRCVPPADLLRLDLIPTRSRRLHQNGALISQHPTLLDQWTLAGSPFLCSQPDLNDDANARRLLTEIDRGAIRKAYLHLTDLDLIQLRHGTTDPLVDRTLERLSAWVREWSDLAQLRYKQFRLHVFSAQGITDVKQVSRLWPQFQRQAWRPSRDVIAVWEPTLLRLWFPGGHAVRKDVLAWLGTQSLGRILADEELHNRGCLFADRRYGEVMFLLQPGCQFLPNFYSRRPAHALHGYHPSAPDSAACWLSNHDITPPRRIDEIFHIMTQTQPLGVL